MSLDIDLYAPAQCPHCGSALPRVEEVGKNITHNVAGMWQKAGVYSALYESDGLTITPEYIAVIEQGVAAMERDFDEYRKLDTPNGWGTAIQALPWLKEWLEACRRNVGAQIHVSR